MATQATDEPRKLSKLIWTTIRRTFSKAAGISGAFVKWGVIAYCAQEYVGGIVICSGPSMEPNIRNHDILLSEHISPRTGNLNRGDIIVARSPNNPRSFICKRIVALPDDHLAQVDGTYLNIPKGHLWIEGDNTYNSTDSRNYGPIPIGLVRGRAVARIWPFVDATFLTSKNDSAP